MYQTKNDDGYLGLVLAVIVLIALWAGLIIGTYVGKKDMKQEAIKHNAAIYQVDKEGNVLFKWNDELSPEKDK